MPLHPALVHLPLGLAVVIPLLALAAVLAIRRGWVPARAWLAVVGLQLLLLLGGVAASRTGEVDEELVEKRVPHAAIEAHEDAAGRFVVGSAVVLVLGLVPLFVRRERVSGAFRFATLAGSVALAGLGLYVGHEGGELVYRHGAAAAHAGAGGGAPATPIRRGSDDD
jgi:uncharacterized membrane protein